jgi:hypothetical protein
MEEREEADLRIPVVTVLCLLCLASPAAAERFCSVPLADWQPREALVDRLATLGLTVVAIRSDDGCYRVIARTAEGEIVRGRFDPATLEPVGRGRGRHGWRGGEPDGD